MLIPICPKSGCRFNLNSKRVTTRCYILVIQNTQVSRQSELRKMQVFIIYCFYSLFFLLLLFYLLSFSIQLHRQLFIEFGNITPYREYLDYICEIEENCGFVVEEDRLRIPSTRRICFIARKNVSCCPERLDQGANVDPARSISYQQAVMSANTIESNIRVS